MKILHTSDWHLGAEMEGRRRDDETNALLAYIIKTVREEAIDTLLVTGDVFDTHSPSNLATKQYYDFLVALTKESRIRNVVIIAGNHDSPSYLDAPSGLLELLNIHVIGNIQSDHLEREVIPLTDGEGQVAAVACAVPYLVSPGLPGKTQAEQDAAYEKYLVEHYKNVVALAKEKYPKTPVIALGHFFAVGGKVSDDKVIRGNLHSVHVEALPLKDIDYLALGHLHKAQMVKGNAKVRYAGSLQKMSFAECDSEKELVIWDTEHPEEYRSVPLTRAEIPEICRMAVREGSVEELQEELKKLQQEETQAGETAPLWVAVQNTGKYCGELKKNLEMWLDDNSNLDLVFCKNKSVNPEAVIKRRSRTIEEMNPMKMFEEFLKEHGLDSGDQAESPEDLEWYKGQLREVWRECEESDEKKG